MAGAPSEEKLKLLVRRAAPSVDDEAVVDFLASSLLVADGIDEVREACEAWMDEAAVQRIVEGLHAVGVLRAAPAAPPRSRVAAVAAAAAPLSDAAAAALASAFAPPPRALAEASLEHEPCIEDEEEDGFNKAALRGQKKRTAKASAKAVGGGSREQPPEAPLEVTAQVSRFHKEAVENEVRGGLDIDIHDLCLSVAGRELLVDSHLKLCPGERYGFVGRNGAGKTSLLRAVAARMIPGFPEQASALLVAQEDVGDESAAVDAVLAVHEELTALLEQEAALLPGGESGEPAEATAALRRHALARRREERRKAARYESKLSGQRGRDARKALLEAERLEREAEALVKDSSIVNDEAPAAAAALLASVRDALVALGPGTLRSRAEVLLLGLGFSPSQLEQPTRQLSGGWRMRVAIARALFARPTVLMMDEPTNHLDWAGVLWLEKYLQSTDMEDVALVVVSHDRAFMDNVCTKVLRIHDKQLHLHDGNYSTFEKSHEEDQNHRAELAQRTQEKRDKVEKQIQQMEQRGRKSNNDNLLKQVASRRTKLGLDGKPWSFNRVGLEGADGHKWKSSYGTNTLAEMAMATESKEAEAKLRLPSAAPLGFEAALLQCRAAAIGFAKAAKPLVAAFDLDVRAKARIAVLGVNGSGKTTLLRSLAGELEPVGGEVYRQPRVVVGFFNQIQAEALPLDQTAVECLLERCPGTTEQDVRAHLGGMGMGRQATQPIGTLSGGEKCRVALASITLRPPHVLLLDEPTNHLDLQTVEALARALSDFEGSVVVTSHDRRLLQEVCSDFYAVLNGKFTKLRALDDFVKLVRKCTAQ